MNLPLTKKLEKIAFSGESIAIVSFLVYLLTLAPGVYGFDSAELATGVYSLGIVHPPGYPLYMLLGQLFILLPIHSVAYRLNLMSAFFAALTVYFLYKIIFRLYAKNWIAWVSSSFLAFSIYFWQMAVVAEVYTLHTCLLACEVLILLYWRESGNQKLLVLFAFIFGLSMTNHTSGLLFAPGFVWMIVSSPKWKWKINWSWAGMIGGFLFALLIYLYIPIRANSSTPLNYLLENYSIDVTTLSGMLWMVSGKAYHFFAFGYSGIEILTELFRGVRLLWRGFMGVGFLLGILGICQYSKKNWKLGLGFILLFLGNFVFYINYRVLDKDTMFLPAFLIFSFFIGKGIDSLDGLLKNGFSELIRVSWREQILPVFWTSLIVVSLALNWQWADMSQTLGPQTFSNTILNSAEEGSTIIASWSPAVVLEYYQVVEGKRPDLQIYNQSRSQVARYYQYWAEGIPVAQILNEVTKDELAAVDEMYRNGVVYSIDYDPTVAQNYEYLPVGTFYQLNKKGN
jgi:hypothetical protein